MWDIHKQVILCPIESHEVFSHFRIILHKHQTVNYCFTVTLVIALCHLITFKEVLCTITLDYLFDHIRLPMLEAVCKT